ncbi:MAG: hypothetical protein KGJ07_02345 [Patescibacteria group bacterium]|nr:hypothetical protein [Patescibacteria group bacterium]MDE2589536.1 hypothetical protein [Patescibacteria group bacterium]
MKQIVLALALFTLVVQPVFAVTAIPTQSPTAAVSPTPIITPDAGLMKELQERIASRVAQLKLVEKKGIIGTVTDVAETQLSVTDLNGDTVFIDVDELTKFTSVNNKSIGISDITKGETIGILGLYNKESRRILARFVDELSLPQVLSGAVTAVDSKNYNLSLTTLSKKDIFIDVENITKTYVYGKTTGTTRSGFSKINQGERIMVIGYPDTNDSSKIIASRIICFPDLPINPRIQLLNPQDLGVTPSTGSGIKLVPIIKK